MAVRFGLIGCGRIAAKHIESLSRMKDACLVAVCDVDQERMDWIEREYREKSGHKVKLRRFVHYRELAEYPGIDAVIIAASSNVHGDVAISALLGNKHVLLEKPMALNLEDAQRIVKLSEDKGLHVMVCHQLRYRPLLKEIKRQISNDVLGKIYLGVASLRWHRSSSYYDAASWRGTWELDGGMLLNQGIHMVDLLCWFLGDIEKASGLLSRVQEKKETEDIALGMFTFSSGAKGLVEANTVTYDCNLLTSITVFGAMGTISLGGRSLETIERWKFTNMEQEKDVAEWLNQLKDDQNEHLYMYQDFLDVLLTGKKKTTIDAREGYRTLEAVFSIYQSALLNRTVTLPQQAFTTLDMKGMGGEQT